MPQKNNWYNKNSIRGFPFDDTATLVDDAGRRLPSDLIVDLRMRFPAELGDRAYLSSLVVGPAVVSATILSSDASVGSLAAVSLARPVDIGRQIALSSQAEGAGGWIVFGEGVDRHAGVWKFSSASQSLFLAQAALRRSSLPIPSLGKLHAEPTLTGVVKLIGGNDISIVREEREVDEVVQDVIVVRLREKDDLPDQNLLTAYAGPCGGRPESRTCGDPQPIESINEVRPDCCGNIYVEFRGCAELTGFAEDDGSCGVMVDCGLGLGEACAVSHLPGPDGTLPNEYLEACDDYTDAPPAGEDPDPPAAIELQPGVDPGGLPWSEDFEAGPPEELTIEQGEFAWMIGGVEAPDAGEVVSLVSSSATAGKVQMQTAQPHGLAVGDQTLVAGSSVAAYSGSFAVLSVENASKATLSVDFTETAVGGVWARQGGSETTEGIGEVDLIAQSPGDAEARVDTEQLHGLIAADVVAISGNSVAGYEGLHTVDSVLGTKRFLSSVSYTSTGSGGLWTLSQSGESGGIQSIVRHSGETWARVNFRAAHGLSAGDGFVALNNAVSGYNVTHRVVSVINSTAVETATTYTSDGLGGLWRKLSVATGDGRVWRSGSAERNIAVWDQGLPAQTGWSSYFRQASVTISLQPGSPGAKRNGGIIFNRRDSQTTAGEKDWWLLELSWDGARTLRLWQIKGDDWTLRSRVTLSYVGLSLRYRLTVSTLPADETYQNAAVFGGVVGLDDGLQASISPVYLPNYAPHTGLIGLHAHRSPTFFDDFNVRFITTPV